MPSQPPSVNTAAKRRAPAGGAVERALKVSCRSNGRCVLDPAAPAVVSCAGPENPAGAAAVAVVVTAPAAVVSSAGPACPVGAAAVAAAAWCCPAACAGAWEGEGVGEETGRVQEEVQGRSAQLHGDANAHRSVMYCKRVVEGEEYLAKITWCAWPHVVVLMSLRW